MMLSIVMPIYNEKDTLFEIIRIIRIAFFTVAQTVFPDPSHFRHFHELTVSVFRCVLIDHGNSSRSSNGILTVL